MGIKLDAIALGLSVKPWKFPSISGKLIAIIDSAIYSRCMAKSGKISLKTFSAAVLAALTAMLIAGILTLLPVYTGLNNDVYDRVFQTVSNPEAADNVVIIAVDDNSINKMMEVTNWPWPRGIYAEFNNYLVNSGAHAVAWDFIFTTPSSGANQEHSQSYDMAFNESLQQGKIILGYEKTPFQIPGQSVNADTRYLYPAGKFLFNNKKELPYFPYLTPLYPLLDPPLQPGFLLNPPDNDGVVRTYIPFTDTALIDSGNPNRETLHFSLAAAMANLVSPGIQERVELDKRGRMLLNWYGPGGPKSEEGGGVFTYYSAWDLYQSAFIAARYPSMAEQIPIKPEYLKDKFIYIGSTVTAHGDTRVTPYSKGYVPFPGVEIHATAFLNLIRGDWLKPIAVWPQLLISAVIAFGIALFGINTFSQLRYSIIATGFTLGSIAAAIYLFHSRHWKLEIAAIFLLLVLSYIFTLLANYIIVGRNRTIIRNAMERYLSPSLLKRIMMSGMPCVDGEEIIASVMFLDIAHFTTFSEKHNPKEIVQILNAYLHEFSNIIIQNKGYVNKFCGDGLMALFGSPEQEEDHADWAINAAFECYARAEELKIQHGLQVRIGVNSGVLIHGNIGGTSKLEFTAIGDTVNSASRMEGLNRYLGSSIVVGDTCWKLSHGRQALVYAGEFILKGKEQPVKLYCHAPMEEAAKEKFEKLRKAYQEKNRKGFNAVLAEFDETMEGTGQQCGLVTFYRNLIQNQRSQDFGMPVRLLDK